MLIFIVEPEKQTSSYIFLNINLKYVIYEKSGSLIIARITSVMLKVKTFSFTFAIQKDNSEIVKERERGRADNDTVSFTKVTRISFSCHYPLVILVV